MLTAINHEIITLECQVVNQGTVVRIDLKIAQGSMPSVEAMTVIGDGFSERTDPGALVIGPTGVGLNPNVSLLYVADSLNNRIAVIPDALDRTSSAGTGTTLFEGGNLNDPLGLVVGSDGHILTVNGNDGFITEITPEGRQIATSLLDNTGGPPPGAGTLFGLVLTLTGELFSWMMEAIP